VVGGGARSKVAVGVTGTGEGLIVAVGVCVADERKVDDGCGVAVGAGRIVGVCICVATLGGIEELLSMVAVIRASVGCDLHAERRSIKNKPKHLAKDFN
jgi:bifunctional ADP-heptose synthase (sugar kinase/adenylyltransferase)